MKEGGDVISKSDNRPRNYGAPRFSVVVPVYRHWHLVPSLLESLDKQTFDRQRFEIILVENGSPESLVPSGTFLNAQVVHCETPGSYAARNHGVEYAAGEWLVFTDADCRPTSQWLQELDETVRKLGQWTLLAGSIEVTPRSSHPGPYEMYDLVKGIPQARYVERGYAATANLAVSKALFQQLGGFDGMRYSGGDGEFCRRAVSNGYSLVYVDAARVAHPARVSWDEIKTKARRVKGGQLSGREGKRHSIRWVLSTLTPPLRGIWNFLTASHHPLRFRVVASAIQLRIWLVEIKELLRLCFGGLAERR
jgi:GT2 family glycosyltransferase